jgi:RNA polymerase sigma factor (sigma-70 family)
MNEYRVKITVRNNLLLSAIENAGYKSCAEFAKEIKSSPQHLSALVAMREAPITSDGEFSFLAKACMEALGAAPSDLWTVEQLNLKLKRSGSEKAVGKDEIDYLLDNQQPSMVLSSPEDQYQEKQRFQGLKEILETLTKKEEQVLMMRCEQEMTLEQVAEAFGVSRERIRQIEAKALRKMRHPTRANQIKKHYDLSAYQFQGYATPEH